jgi:hypothetical protein
MFIWQFLLKEIREHELSTREALAAWVPGRFGRYNAALEIQLDDADWREWEDNRHALEWLADRREKPSAKRTRGDRIPPPVTQAIETTLMRTVNQLPSNWLSECDGIKIAFTNRRGEGSTGNPSGGQYEDLAELWQAVFLSYFQPSVLQSSNVCEVCGKSLGRTATGKQSKQRFCPPCRTKRWKSENSDLAKEYDREQKKANRDRAKRG